MHRPQIISRVYFVKLYPSLEETYVGLQRWVYEGETAATGAPPLLLLILCPSVLSSLGYRSELDFRIYPERHWPEDTSSASKRPSVFPSVRPFGSISPRSSLPPVRLHTERRRHTEPRKGSGRVTVDDACHHGRCVAHGRSRCHIAAAAVVGLQA